MGILIHPERFTPPHFLWFVCEVLDLELLHMAKLSTEGHLCRQCVIRNLLTQLCVSYWLISLAIVVLLGVDFGKHCGAPF